MTKLRGYGVEITTPLTRVKTVSGKMVPGQIGILIDKESGTRPHIGELVLKVYNSLVLLSDPKSTWPQDNIEVELLPQGTKIEITTGDPEAVNVRGSY